MAPKLNINLKIFFYLKISKKYRNIDGNYLVDTISIPIFNIDIDSIYRLKYRYRCTLVMTRPIFQNRKATARPGESDRDALRFAWSIWARMIKTDRSNSPARTRCGEFLRVKLALSAESNSI